MKVCIAGSSGFIGSNLVEACLRKGWDVLAVDNLSGSSYEMADPKRVQFLGGRYSFTKMDINETERLTELVKGCDTIFLLAAIPRVSYSTDHPQETNHANISGTLSVLESARKSRVGRVIFSCSSSVFGGTKEFPTKESARMNPMSLYALHKVAGAEYMRLYYDLFGLDTCSLVYYNVTGRLQRTGGAYSTCIPAFMECAVQGKPCRIDGLGDQSRDFTHVDDVVAANLLAAEHPEPLRGGMFNIACGETHSVLEVYEKINALAGGTLTKIHAPRRLGDPMKSLADISKAREILGYEPRVSFDFGLEKCWTWWRDGCSIEVGK